MSSTDLVDSIIQVAGTGGFAAALVKGIEAVSKHRQKIAAEQTKLAEVEASVVTTAEREETARQRLHVEELGVAERIVLDRAQEHQDCLKEAKQATERATQAEVRAAAAEARVDHCEEQHTYAKSLIAWLQKRMDKIDGGSVPPPPPPFTQGSPAE